LAWPIANTPVLRILAGTVLIVLDVLGRIPFVIWSLFGWALAHSQFNLGASNQFVVIVIAIPVIVVFVVSELGFLFALSEDSRTLSDHFLGIKLVDVRGTEFSYQPNSLGSLIGWFIGNRGQEFKVHKPQL
jgi:hypothetical protein